MANRNVSAVLKIRRDTTVNWTTLNPVLSDGELGLDVTKNQLKVGDGIATWNVLPYLNSDLLDGVHLADIRLGQNLLHNWDFQSRINQRKVSGAISSGSYFYDRWIRASGTVTTNAAYLAIGASAVIEQRIEGNLLAGKTVTVSVQAGGTVYSVTDTMPTSEGTVSVTLTGWGWATLGYATGYMYVRLAPEAASNVRAVKLEMGTVSTLHLDSPMDYGVELFKCQRYFIRLKSGALYGLYSVGAGANPNMIFYPIPLPCPMRVLPSIVVSGALSQVNPTVVSMSGSILQLVSTNIGAYVKDKVYVLTNENDANAYIDLSSDL